MIDKDFNWVLNDPLFWEVNQVVEKLTGMRYQDQSPEGQRSMRKSFAWGSAYGMGRRIMLDRAADPLQRPPFDSDGPVRVRVRPDRRIADRGVQSRTTEKEPSS